MTAQTAQTVQTGLQNRRWVLGAVLAAVNGIIYLVAEGISAAAWSDPSYSYSYNYISDLGVPEVGEFEGRVIDSPLYWVMNTGFILHGVLFLAVVLLLKDILATRGARRALVTLAAVHAVGIILVGVFHGSPQATEDGTVVLHGAGALLAIAGGNIAAVVTGAALLRGRTQPLTDAAAAADASGSRRHPRLGWAFIGLGVLGIASFLFLMVIAGSDWDGIPERLAVYTVMIAEFLTAGAVLAAHRQTSERHQPNS